MRGGDDGSSNGVRSRPLLSLRRHGDVECSFGVHKYNSLRRMAIPRPPWSVAVPPLLMPFPGVVSTPFSQASTLPWRTHVAARSPPAFVAVCRLSWTLSRSFSFSVRKR